MRTRRLLVSVLLLSALLPCVGGRAEEPPGRRPNLVYILADDLGYGEVGCYGQTKIKTPHLDRMAAGGMRFTQHYSGSPVCAPSRCVLLTGLHTGHAYIRDNDEMGHRGKVWGDPKLEGQRPLPKDTRTLGHVLQDAGYVTAAIGKWGLGWVGSSGDPNRQGFDHYYGVVCQRVAHNHYPTHLWRDGEKEELRNPFFKSHQKLPPDADPNEAASYAAYSGPDYSMDKLTEDALDFIRGNRAKPFFLYVPYLVPHVALQVPEDSLAEYAEAFEETPYLGDRGYLPHRTPRAAYAAMISRMDRDVGRILDLLAELGLSENTLVVFSSDNGPSGVGGVDKDFFDSAGGLRGRKGQVWEGGLRVPTIAYWPGRIAGASTTDHISAFQDVLPTFAELAGAPVPKGLDGISFAPTLLGKADEQKAHDHLYWEYARRLQAVRMGKWKGVRPKPTVAVELYDLEADPAETTDVAAAHPEVVEQVEALMRTSRTESSHFPLKRE